MNIIELYRLYILKPIEDDLNELYVNYYSNQNNIILKNYYKKMINKYEKIYLNKLENFDKLINTEMT